MSFNTFIPNSNVNNAFGWTLKDQYLTNLSAQNAMIVSLNSALAGIQRLQKQIVQLNWNDSIPTTTYTLQSLPANNVIYQIDPKIQVAGAVINIAFDDTSLAEIGDQITFMAKTGTIGTATVNYDSTFYYTQCGGPSTVDSIPVNGRLSTTFTFDGSKYVNTSDNC